MKTATFIKELPGSTKGIYDHTEALHEAGYTVAA